MHIAFLAAANSIHTIRWIRFFAERGHTITWISLAPPIPEAKELASKTSFFEITPSPLADIHGARGILYLPGTVTKVRGILADRKPDVLHIHSAGTYGLVGALAGFHPSILTPWGSDILLTSSLKKPLVRFVVRSADAYTCDGENTFKKLISFGASEKEIRFIRFGTDTRIFTPNAGMREKDKTAVVSLRSLEPLYDIETLIRAAAIVSKEKGGIRFILAGEGSEKSRLEALARELGLMDSGVVRFIGRVSGDALVNTLRNADIYVSTSLSDSGLASSTAEAMACGLPVVVSDSGDNKEWVKENENGFVIPLRDPQALAEKIVWLTEHAPERAAFGAHNRALIEEKNDYMKEMGKVETLYESIAASR